MVGMMMLPLLGCMPEPIDVHFQKMGITKMTDPMGLDALLDAFEEYENECRVEEDPFADLPFDTAREARLTILYNAVEEHDWTDLRMYEETVDALAVDEAFERDNPVDDPWGDGKEFDLIAEPARVQMPVEDDGWPQVGDVLFETGTYYPVTELPDSYISPLPEWQVVCGDNWEEIEDEDTQEIER